MPTGDGRCGVCGYWHEPGGHHIGRGAEQPMRFPSRAARLAMAESAQRQMRALVQWNRQRLIEQAVRWGLATDRERLSPKFRLPLLEDHAAGVPMDDCPTCTHFIDAIRARFREIAG